MGQNINTSEIWNHVDDYLRAIASMGSGGGMPFEQLTTAEVMAEAKKIYPEGNPDLIAYVAAQMGCEGEAVGLFVVEAIKKIAGI